MDIEAFRQNMQKLAENDRDKKEATITAPDLQQALAQAVIELDLPLKDIAYEIIQKNHSGFYKWGAKDCIILAYESDVSKDRDRERKEALAKEQELAAYNASIREDGKVSLRCLDGKVYVTVSAPKGDGNEATFSQIKYVIKRRGLSNLDQKLIDSALEEKTGEPILVGKYSHTDSPVNAEISFRIAEDEMVAYMTLLEPSPGGNDITENDIRNELKGMGIIKGLDESLIISLAEYPIYGKEFEIAKGEKPINGNDASIEYFFETDKKKLMPTEVNGKVDYKNMSIIQNVVQGQMLAKKIPLGEGKNGYTVFGSMLFAKDGKDLTLQPGDNVMATEDGMALVAEINGQVFLSPDKKVMLSPVFTVPGDVNIKNGGNIDFIGAVVVKGNVEDSFSVKATKNISINGTVGKSRIMGGSDIMISQGITGKEGGEVTCKGNLYVRFIGNAKVDCEGDVIVRDEIVNSQIDSNSSIICQSGKRGAIIGGHLRASKKIIAKNLGNASGVETIVEVGFEPTKRTRMTELDTSINAYKNDLEEINLNLLTYQNNLRDGIKISKEKFESIKTLKGKKDETVKLLDEAVKEYTEIKEYLDGLKNEGTISVEGRVYPGVKIVIADAEYRVRNEMKFSTFYKEGPMVRIKEFSEERDGR